jgi:microcystin-dependent protein
MSTLTLDQVPNPDADGVVGAIIAYAGVALPGPKYRWCHGTQTVRRAEFALLFSRLGESWGAGDGSTTFNLPDLDKKTLAGVDSTGADTAFDKVGDTGGTAASSLPAHTHDAGSLTASAASDVLITPSAITPVLGGAYAAAGGTQTTLDVAGTTGSTGSGSGDNWPPYAAVRFIIKVA